MAGTWDFRATHVVPQSGMPAWEAPDVSRPTTPLDPLLPVQLAERRGDWGRIVCANSWSAWVDGRLLVPVPQEPPAAGRPLARTEDPRPLLARVGETLARYRRAAEDLADGLSDGETFRDRTRGLRVGLVVDGESVWLYDGEHERWVYCDGLRLSTFATSSGPTAREEATPGDGDTAGPGPEPVNGPEPTRIVTPEPATPATGPEPPGGTPRHEPTRVVTPETPPGTGDADEPRLAEPAAPARDEDRPDATRVVEHPEATQAVRGPEATRVVEGPEAPRAVEPPEATRAGERPEDHAVRGPHATAVVRPPDPTRVLEPPDPTQVVDRPDGTRAAEQPETTRAVARPEPTRTVDRPEGPPGGSPKTPPGGER
jgi:hypothetical protein